MPRVTTTQLALGARTDGTPPLKGRGLVFTSLSAMRENFRTLWDNLSRPGVEARTLHVTLREGDSPTAPSPLSAQIARYPGHKRRNDIQTGLQILADLFLEDITRDPSLQGEFLAQTYATSGALSQYALISKKILESRYSLTPEPLADIESAPVTTKKELNHSDRLRLQVQAITQRTRP